MSDADLSDLPSDPDLGDEQFSVIRRQQIVGANGVATVQATTFPQAGQPPLLGSIFPSGDNSLVREEAFQVQAQAITVITAFRLRGASKDGAGNSFEPDIVVWNGGNYLVKSLKPWTSFGAGFVEAECASFDFNAPAPT